jgi:hypothetical protein
VVDSAIAVLCLRFGSCKRIPSGDASRLGREFVGLSKRMEYT